MALLDESLYIPIFHFVFSMIILANIVGQLNFE
jgi:hypothetical protein